MEIDFASRQPDRDKEPDAMSVDANASKDAHNDKGEQPAEAAEPKLTTNLDVTAGLERPREGGSPMKMPEQSGKTPQLGVSQGSFFQTFLLT